MLINLKQKIAETFLILRESLKSFKRNDSFSVSASFAYYGFFAIIPLSLLLIYSLGNYIVSSQTSIKVLENISSEILPGFSGAVFKEVYSLSQHKGIWGTFSIIALFWAITPLASSFRSAFYRIFRIDEQTPYLKAKIINVSAVLIILLLFIFLAASKVLYSQITPVLKELPFLFYIGNILFPLLITTIFFFAFYFLLSPVRLRFSCLFTGALTTGILWNMVSPAFTLFMTLNPKFGLTFGSLKAIFIILMWIYYSFTTILFGAEVMANIKRKNALLLKGLFTGDLQGRSQKMLIRKFIRSYDAGETVFREGEGGDQMFFVLSGAISIQKGGHLLRTLGQGEYFGEMAMLLNTPRTATVIVEKPDTQLIIISKENFEIILWEEPKIVLSILKEMSERLKITSEHVR